MRAPACEAVLGLHASMRRNGAERVRGAAGEGGTARIGAVIPEIAPAIIRDPALYCTAALGPGYALRAFRDDKGEVFCAGAASGGLSGTQCAGHGRGVCIAVIGLDAPYACYACLTVSSPELPPVIVSFSYHPINNSPCQNRKVELLMNGLEESPYDFVQIEL